MGEGSSSITVLMHALDDNISDYRIDIWADANAASTCGAGGRRGVGGTGATTTSLLQLRHKFGVCGFVKKN